MRIPVIKGIIKRRLLVNFRADPGVVHRLLPEPFRPKLHRGHAIVGICLIRLEQIRPAGLPGFVGISSENAAHRVAVTWTANSGSEREGVFIPRRDTGSVINLVAGGKAFPGEHHSSKFDVKDDGRKIDFSMNSEDGKASIAIVGEACEALPPLSCFSSVRDASAFFEGGSLGYSVTRDPHRFDGLLLRTQEWHIGALSISKVESKYFSDKTRFPEGSIVFDHALIMRDVQHEWHQAEELHGSPRTTDPLIFTH